MADALTEIFRAAGKHPNSRVSKLIHQVEAEPTQKNIVLLLIELAEHAEYSIDFNVPLKYYLDLFERCGINKDLVLNEAGLLLVNSSKIYSKRIDYVQSLVERQIVALSNADADAVQNQRPEPEQTENAAPAEKPKRGRKRILEAPSDPYEIELTPKKFKRLTAEKRFASPKVTAKAKAVTLNIEMEQHIHPAGWQYATIYDLENEEDVDTKRNYKLFTFHVEHRYNTLVPDINFRLHFKVKDYMDEQEEMEADEACNTDRSWPPLSEAYVQKYLRLENYVLGQDTKANKRKATDQQQDVPKRSAVQVTNIEPANQSQQQQQQQQSLNVVQELESKTLDVSADENLLTNNMSSEDYKNDSGYAQSLLNESDTTVLENSQLSCALEISQTEPNLSQDSVSARQIENDSALGTSVLEQSNTTSKTDSALETSIEDEASEHAKRFDATEENLRESGKGTANSLATQQPANEMIEDKTASPENNAASEISETQQAPTANTCKDENDLNIDILNTISEEGQDLKEFYIEELAKATDSRRDSALSGDQHHDHHQSNPGGDNLAEKFTISVEKLNKIDVGSGKSLNIDVVDDQDKNAAQLHVQLPNADDEGVFLSDLEDQDCRLLSPIIKTANILPGVERKDITIVMDDELRQALEMRDGIIKHFGCETFTLPVVAEPRKTNLIFNILKLPEKLVRRKIIFKLGPDMDLYIKARCFKRTRADPVEHTVRNFQLLKWFSLNNTDMTNVCMTPPQSPGRSTEFCGFTDTEEDNTSCPDFCGFTEEEQVSLNSKAVSRLSRDSGVGVDVNSLTPEKETLEIVFEEEQNLAMPKIKTDLNSNEIDMETTATILEQLPEDIRHALRLELDENSNPPPPLMSDNSAKVDHSDSRLTDNLCSDAGAMDIDSEAATEVVLHSTGTKESDNTGEKCSPTQTQETEAILTENSNETHTESQRMPSELEAITETQSNTEALERDVPRSNDKPSTQESDKMVEEVVGKELELDNCSDDGITVDLDSQGTKTKIQKWHAHLQPILAKSRERHHFDIYKLGTEIIDTVQSQTTPTSSSVDATDRFPNSDSSASFDNVMADKDKSYVSRYFLSTLLLANQSNIEISIENKSSEEPSAWHDVNLKLLSTKRHTVAIEDNIGLMIDGKQKTPQTQNVPPTARKVEKASATNHQNEGANEEVEVPRSGGSSWKTSLKRSSEQPASATACIAEKKPKEISFATTTTPSQQHTTTTVPHLVQSVQILQPSFASSPPAAAAATAASHAYNCLQSSTGPQAQHKHHLPPFLNVNMNTIRPLQPIEKVQKTSDDYDSGIFSVDEMSTS